MSYRKAVLDLGPEGYWRFGEPAGTTTLVDETGNHPATAGTGVLGAAGALTGDTNTAMTFSGAAANVVTPGGTWAIDSAAWSAMALVNLNATFPTTFHESLFQVYATDVTQHAAFHARRNATNNRLSYWDNTNTWKESTATLPGGAWSHVAMTVAGTALNIYVDGANVLATTITAPADIYTAVYIGASTSADPLKGILDEPAIFTKTLTAAQIQGVQAQVANPTADATLNVKVRNAANTGWTDTTLKVRNAANTGWT